MWLVAPSGISFRFKEQNTSVATEGAKHLQSKKKVKI